VRAAAWPQAADQGGTQATRAQAEETAVTRGEQDPLASPRLDARVLNCHEEFSKLEVAIVSTGLKIVSLAAFLSWMASKLLKVIEPWFGN
jgi:hypothetical protein